MDKRFFFPDIGQEKLIDDVLSGKRHVVLLGRLPIGRDYMEDLIQSGVAVDRIYNYASFDEDYEDTFYGIPCLHPSKMQGSEDVVVICGNSHYQKLMEYAKRSGAADTLPYYFLYSGQSWDYQGYKRILQVANTAKGKLYAWEHADSYDLGAVELTITHRCTLRCEKCANLMSYFTDPRDADFDTMCRTMDKILSAGFYIEEVRVLGGEPFLNKDLAKYIRFLLDYENVGLVSILSNATLMPDEATLSALENERVIVTMSNYGKISRQLDRMVDTFEQRKIFYRVYNQEGWIDCNSICYHEHTPEQLTQKYKTCSVHNCNAIFNGKLYHCPYAAAAANLQAIPQRDTDYLDIMGTQPELLKKAMIQFLEAEFSPVCAYCVGRPNEDLNIPVANQISKPLPYHKYTYNHDEKTS